MEKYKKEKLNISKEERIEELLTRGVENIYPSREFLERKLKDGKKLKVYLGIDPTGPDLHLGHAIPLRKMKQFQDLGHKVIILIGDFTGMIGDPTDKSATRVRLSKKQVLKNAESYKNQIGKILDLRGKNPVKFEYNSKWLAKLNFEKVIELSAYFTVQQMIVRDMFRKRLKEDKPIHLHEFLYPLMQAYDSVALDVDGEVGGNDQTFNMLAGRDLMKAIKDKEKFVLTTKLLVDPTGKKMGKTEGNMIRLTDSSDEMFGKVMSWPDEMILIGFELLSNVTMEGIKIYEKALKKGENPRDIKFKLAEEVVESFYGFDESLAAGKRFNRLFKEKKLPLDIPERKIKQKMMGIIDLIYELGIVSSKSEARRLIIQGAVRIDEEKITDPETILGIHKGMIVQVGKRKFVRIK